MNHINGIKKQSGNVLLGVLIISFVMSLFAMMISYFVNEEINTINALNQNQILRHHAYDAFLQAETFLQESSFFNAFNLFKEEKNRSSDYKIMPYAVINDNIDNFYGSLFAVFQITASAYQDHDKHNEISYQAYYWRPVSLGQFLHTEHLSRTVFATVPVMNVTMLDKIQKKAYGELIDQLQKESIKFTVDEGSLIINQVINNVFSKQKVALGFNCSEKDSCQLQLGFLYKDNQYHYVLMVFNQSHLALWVIPFDKLNSLSNYQVLTVDLTKLKGFDKSILNPNIVLVNEAKKSEILTEVKQNNHQSLLLWQLNGLNQFNSISQPNGLGWIKRIFPISKKLNLETSGFFAFDDHQKLWYFDQKQQGHLLTTLPGESRLINLSVINDQEDQFKLFLTLNDQINTYQLSQDFTSLKKLSSRLNYSRLTDASVRLGAIWQLSALNQLTIFNLNQVDQPRHFQINGDCLFQLFLQIKLYCGNTEIKINDIVHPYHREAFRQIRPYG